MTDERRRGLPASVRRLWPLASLLAGAGIAYLLWTVPGGRTIFWLSPPIGIAIIAVVCFRDLARRDRPAFLSVIGPAFGVALLAVISPPRVAAFLAMPPILFIGLFVFTEGMGRWWWRHVLRRSPPTAAQKFDHRLGAELRGWAEALRRDGPEVAVTDASVAIAHAALARIRDLPAPDADWATLRDDYAEIGERWVLLARSELPADQGTELQGRLDELKTRRSELRART